MATRNQLSVRQTRSSTKLADAVRVEEGFAFDLKARRVILLIHGFANPQERAEDSFRRFTHKLRGAAGALIAGDEIWEFHWPGNAAHWFDPPPFVYSGKIKTACKAGELLGRFLHARLSGGQRVVIVAHSLGCRVTLEAIRALAGDARLEHVVLFAAAVPVEFCLPRAQSPYADRVGVGEHVLYSPRDQVLRIGFPVGQRLGGEPGGAVGLYGRPFFRWTSRTNTWLGHRRYWREGATARRVSEILGARPSLALPAAGPATRRLQWWALPGS